MTNLVRSQSVLELDCHAAREYFLKDKSYCNIDLPPYYNFQKILDDTYNIYNRLFSKPGSKFKNFANPNKAKNIENINHHIYANKGGDLSWRNFQIIHPLLYVHLVCVLTETNNWEKLTARFVAFRKSDKVQCLSIPRKSLINESDKATQVNSWWKNVEQKSIVLGRVFNSSYNER